MKTYDQGASTHGHDLYWLRRWWRRILHALDRERELVTLRNVLGMMAEARRRDAVEYQEMLSALKAAQHELSILRTHVRNPDQNGSAGI